MKTIYLHNAILYTPAEFIEQGTMIFRGGTILAVGSAETLARPDEAQSIDAGGQYLVPGFIDLQVNGAFGMDFTANPETIWQVGERLSRFGVTAFLPTIVTSPIETVRHAQAVWLNGPPAGYQGAHAIGLHLEGPYLNPKKSGAHDPAYLQLPDAETYRQWKPANGIQMVTLAPELPGAIQAIQILARNGVVISAGHSLASLDQALEGIEAGISYGTHLFNAMPPLDHREPGLVGALLSDRRITAGMIVDGIHVHPSIVNLAWKALGPGRTSLVSDAMAALGKPPGRYELGNRYAIVDGTSARLDDGRLAGSLLSLDQALRNLMKFTGASLQESLPGLTQVPARLLHQETSLGVLADGARADFLLLTPELQVSEVWIDGQRVIPSPG